jgi:hypothetical protein
MSSLTRDTQGGAMLGDGMIFGTLTDLAPVTNTVPVSMTVAADTTLVEIASTVAARFTITRAGVTANPASATHGAILPGALPTRYGVHGGDVISVCCVTSNAANIVSILEGGSS